MWYTLIAFVWNAIFWVSPFPEHLIVLWYRKPEDPGLRLLIHCTEIVSYFFPIQNLNQFNLSAEPDQFTNTSDRWSLGVCSRSPLHACKPKGLEISPFCKWLNIVSCVMCTGEACITPFFGHSQTDIQPEYVFCLFYEAETKRGPFPSRPLSSPTQHIHTLALFCAQAQFVPQYSLHKHRHHTV